MILYSGLTNIYLTACDSLGLKFVLMVCGADLVS